MSGKAPARSPTQDTTNWHFPAALRVRWTALCLVTPSPWRLPSASSSFAPISSGLATCLTPYSAGPSVHRFPGSNTPDWSTLFKPWPHGAQNGLPQMGHDNSSKPTPFRDAARFQRSTSLDISTSPPADKQDNPTLEAGDLEAVATLGPDDLGRIDRALLVASHANRRMLAFFVGKAMDAYRDLHKDVPAVVYAQPVRAPVFPDPLIACETRPCRFRGNLNQLLGHRARQPAHRPC